MNYAALFPLLPHYGARKLIFFFATDCPTCRMIAPYLSKLHAATGNVIGVSQDSAELTSSFLNDTHARIPTHIDESLTVSKSYGPETVPALFLIAPDGKIEASAIGFEKSALNAIALRMEFQGVLAEEFDGAPPSKPGCMSRHLEPVTPDGALAQSAASARSASRIVLDEDPIEYSMRAFGDPLPVVPPTLERVACMLREATVPRDEVIAQIPPCYGLATVEKIAANAVMAGCEPPMMKVLIPLLRAICDERFNLHGVQATTHFAAPLVIINGPVRHELGFRSTGNVFSNVARANSTLGRALQLILTNIGGARPGEIDMSTLGNPGKFSWCIAENEEASPWDPLHVEKGFTAGDSVVTLFAGDGIRGVSEHTARTGQGVLRAICATLATVWSWRVCLMPEAVVVLCPEHVDTLHRSGFSKQDVRQFLFDNTGVPIRAYEEDDGGEGTQARATYEEIQIFGEPCYRKFRSPDAIQIVVAGGTAGKFSAVIGSWATGPRGSQMVSYPISRA